MTCTNKVLACAAAAVVFSSSIRALADEPAHAPPPPSASVVASPVSPGADASERRMERGGRIFLIASGAVTVVGLAGLGISLAAHESAASRHNAFPSFASGFKDCRTASECADLASAREDVERWRTGIAISAGLAGAAGITTAMIALLWPRESARITPTASAGPSSGAVGLSGSF